MRVLESLAARDSKLGASYSTLAAAIRSDVGPASMITASGMQILGSGKCMLLVSPGWRGCLAGNGTLHLCVASCKSRLV